MKLPIRGKRRDRPLIKINGANLNDLLDETAAALFVGLSVSYLRIARVRKSNLVGPVFLKPDGYHVRYNKEDLRKFLKMRFSKFRVVDPASQMKGRR